MQEEDQSKVSRLSGQPGQRFQGRKQLHVIHRKYRQVKQIENKVGGRRVATQEGGTHNLQMERGKMLFVNK